MSNYLSSACPFHYDDRLLYAVRFLTDLACFFCLAPAECLLFLFSVVFVMQLIRLLSVCRCFYHRLLTGSSLAVQTVVKADAVLCSVTGWIKCICM